MEGELSSTLDMCPVCKSTRLTTPKIEFRISPKCYHRICAGCVDRKFVGGKTECPISGCKKQLWKRDWRKQTFEDLEIERDVDIRKRVMKALDKQEEEFETKRDYDDFLEMREEMVMNLLSGSDAKATLRKLDEYEIAMGLKPRPVEEAGKNTGKSGKQRSETEANSNTLIKGLKKIIVPLPRAAYDPFMGMSKARDYYEVRNSYETRYDKLKKDPMFDPAGYDFDQYMDESLLRAFAGFGVFIEDEMVERVSIQALEEPLSKQASLKVEDDPF